MKLISQYSQYREVGLKTERKKKAQLWQGKALPTEKEGKRGVERGGAVIVFV